MNCNSQDILMCRPKQGDGSETHRLTAGIRSYSAWGQLPLQAFAGVFGDRGNL
ncbi:hypothetical protein COCC4DRAFT_33905, partial [Bipolaris maydis ATCC 48331]